MNVLQLILDVEFPNLHGLLLPTQTPSKMSNVMYYASEVSLILEMDEDCISHKNIANKIQHTESQVKHICELHDDNLLEQYRSDDDKYYIPNPNPPKAKSAKRKRKTDDTEGNKTDTQTRRRLADTN